MSDVVYINDNINDKEGNALNYNNLSMDKPDLNREVVTTKTSTSVASAPKSHHHHMT